MAIKLSQGFRITSKEPIDKRFILTKAMMADAGTEFPMPNNYFAVCHEDNRIYIYNENNKHKPETGKFRPLDKYLDLSGNNLEIALAASDFIAVIKDDIQVNKEDIALIQTNLQQARIDLDQNIQKTEEINTTLNDLISQTTSIALDLNSTKERVDASENAIMGLITDTVDLRSDLTNLQEDITAIEARVTASENYIVNVENSLKTTQNEVTNLSGRVDSLETSRSNLNQRVVTLEGNVIELNNIKQNKLTLAEDVLSDMKSKNKVKQGLKINANGDLILNLENIELVDQLSM